MKLLNTSMIAAMSALFLTSFAGEVPGTPSNSNTFRTALCTGATQANNCLTTNGVTSPTTTLFSFDFTCAAGATPFVFQCYVSSSNLLCLRFPFSAVPTPNSFSGLATLTFNQMCNVAGGTGVSGNVVLTVYEGAP